ncbi:eCIS core domain-containing protein [Coleofasciculus sp. G2-EDA-02]|uniref:eCIS core domain-containing protein n=1 Tax=Coleofasciculus sp. G2-EDA-02 TaxID=3069529 RepID=UPI0032F0F414
MYKPVQKKSSSWTPPKVQKKGKSAAKLGRFSIQPKPNQTSAPSQEIGDDKRASADTLAANVMRGLQAKELELAEGSTVQRKSESPWTAGFDAAPPTTQTPTPQMGTAFAPVSENPIQRQCADCAKEEKEQAGEVGKDVEEIGIQTKLTIGAPGDPYEQEADRVASQVMSMSAPPDSSASVQRRLDTNNPNQIWQRAQSITPVVQKRIDPRVQMGQMIQRAAQIDANQASGDLESRLNASKGGGSPLSEDVRGFMEPRFGADFSGVRVHTGGEAVQMNRQLGAQAFTHGSDVYFGAGKSPGNNELTAHELTHVVQQTGVVHRKNKQEQIQPSLLHGIVPKSQVLGHLQAMQEQLNIDGALYRKEIAQFQQTHSTEQILEKQQQLLPAQNGSITQTGDSSKIFRACGDSNAAGQITHETKFNAPDGSAKTRKNVGVGEEVEFKAPSAGKWTASAGTPVTLPNGNTFNWTAPNRAASVKIKFELGGKESSVSMNVIEPNGITGTKTSEDPYPAGTQGAGMRLNFNFHPKKVSFGNAFILEIPGPATSISGYFKSYRAASLYHHPNPDFVPIAQDNTLGAIRDQAAFSGYPAPWKKGGFKWDIPNHFRVKGEGGNGKKFTTVTQAFSISGSDGTSKVTKAGESVERTP